MRHHFESGRYPILILGSLLLFACTGASLEGAVLQQGDDVPERIIVIGDLHGDLEAARAALRLGRAIDKDDHWIGGRLVVVQLGDILDRGDEEEKVLDLFRSLGHEADEAGGAIHLLIGNHELMNASMDFRYVTAAGFSDFENMAGVDPPDSLLTSLPPFQRHRAAVFRPGGQGARLLAGRKTALIIGNTLFVHGGILPEHVDMGLGQMNATIQLWLLGEIPEPEWIATDRSPAWTRLYSDAPDAAACDTLSSVLKTLSEDRSVDRMVVGHTPLSGVTAYCGGRVWCIDVGMAAYYKGFPEVLEIRGDVVRSLR
jgi:hypothetical protein